MIKNLHTLSLLLSVSIASNSNAATSNLWSDTPVTVINGLEMKLTEPINAEMLAVILSRDNSNNTNRLDAITIREPYDGSNNSQPTRIDFSPTLFALGEVCVDNNIAIIPYIKDFNVGVIKFDGMGFSSSFIPTTITNNFDNTNCAVTNDGVFIVTHDLTDQETEIYQSTNSGISYDFYGSYDSIGPFSGGIRESFVADYATGEAMTVSQMHTGMVRATQFNTSNNSPNFIHTNLEMLTMPTGFTEVKESSGNKSSNGMVFSFNADGHAKVFNIPMVNPIAFTVLNLGPINNMGSQFSFQGFTGLNVPDLNGNPMIQHVAWDSYSEVHYATSPPSFTTDLDYPLVTVGGPIDGCVIRQIRGLDTINVESLFIGPTVGTDGTSLFRRNIKADPIYAGRFEVTPPILYEADCQ